MPQAKSMAIRQSILSQYQKGEKVSSLARTFKVSRGTIYQILNRYKVEGMEGLKPRYTNCGKERPKEQDFLYRAVRCLRTWHSSWGAEKIHAEMRQMRPNMELTHYRTFYRWFHWNNQLDRVLKSTLPKTGRKWAKKLHEGWQIDAKEEMVTRDGKKQCWLNITDEYSGTVIDPPVFSL